MEPAQNNGSDIPVLFVDRKTGFPSDFIGFDYEKAGQAMAEKALQAGYRSICLLTGNPDYSSEKDFLQGLSDHDGRFYLPGDPDLDRLI